ncbi:MAG: sigma-70 family RNA polymerase sigma factor, partial [Planctomycetes bacterium]|nr:sigma-70 family RNA polymerase sigma factor [Planctomycetota bacterium]
MSLPLQAEVRAAFLRFRDQHDHAALAFVFDRTAQGLLLVANHLAAPGVDAEDLVQTTFVQAIRNAQAFDANRPLEPWLLGILTHEAHNARRRAARRPDPRRLRPEPIDDPASKAEVHDEVARMQTAIEAMPEPTRSVLVLYLVHSMTPTEIAHALGHPVGSVKSWVHRGLERLRDRLPVGLAVTAGLGLGARQWLPLRDAVLAAGRAHTDVPSVVQAGSLGGPVAVRPQTAFWLRLVAVVAGVAVPILWWALGGRDDRTVDRGGNAPAVAASPGAAARPSLAPAVGSERSAEASRVASADGDAAALHVVARWSDGSPAAIGFGVASTFVADARLARRDGSTDREGRAQMVGLEPGSATLSIDRGMVRDVELLPGANRIEIELPAGRTVHGRVVDELGQPVPSAVVWLSHLPRRDDGWPLAQTAKDGTFALRDVPVGSAVAAFAEGFVPTRAMTVRETAASADELVLAFERRAATVRIEVVTAQGDGVAGAWVQVGGSEAMPADGVVATDDCRPPP